MHKLPFAFSGGLLAVLLPVCLIAAGAAQSPPASSPEPSKTADTPVPAKPNANDEFLVKAGKLYYSTSKTGLNSFDCAVHPDWRALLLSAAHGSAVAADDPRIVLLKTVNIKLHARLKGGSVLDWNPPSTPETPLDSDSITLLDHMHLGIEKTMQGFIQLWTPFVNGSVIPASTDGPEIVQTEKGHRISLEANGISLTEEFDSSQILRHFDVVTGGMTIHVAPSYQPTEQGLLVSAFLASIQPPGVPADQAKEMHVEVEYQTVGGSPIPSRVNIDVTNSGTLNSVLDGCTVNP
jgi:hypothetical protein